MLITTCTHCLARFRVAPQQLNARQGQVRCGRCRRVFNGFEALERHPDDDTGSRLLAAREAVASIGVPPEDIETLPVEEEEGDPAVAAAEQLPPTSPPDTSLTPDEPPASASLSAPAAPAPLRPSRFTEPMYPEVPAAAPARAWRFGVALLAVMLAAEVIYATRETIAQRYPPVRPILESTCAAFGCAVAWPHNEALLKLEDSELLEVPGKPRQIALGARIRNLALVAQEFPHLELTLTDISGQAAVRRVVRPNEYMGRPLAAGEVLASGAEIAIQLRLETNQVAATGYELLLFYP